MKTSIELEQLINLEKYKHVEVSEHILRDLLSACLLIAHEYIALPEIEGIAIGGSLGRAFVDGKSDIEMYVYYTGDLPSREVLQEIIGHKLGAVLTRSDDVHRYHPARGYHSFFRVKDTNVELGYRNLAGIKDKIVAFQEKLLLPKHGIHDTPFGHYPSWLMSCLKESTIVYDKEGVFEEIQKWLSIFPENVRRETIQYYFNDSFFLFKDKLLTAAERKDIFLFQACVARIVRSLTILLFALNGVYYPGDKRNMKYLEKFEIIPLWFIEKITNLHTIFNNTNAGYQGMLAILKSLLEDIEVIIESHESDILLKVPCLDIEC